MDYSETSNVPIAADRIFMGLAGIGVFASNVALLVYVQEISHAIDDRFGVSVWKTRAHDSIVAARWLNLYSVFMLVWMSVFFTCYGKDTSKAMMRGYSLKSASCPDSGKSVPWIITTLQITLFAAAYFVDYVVLGLWIGLRWCLVELNVEHADDSMLDNQSKGLHSLIALTILKIVTAFIGHAWAVVRRRCGEGKTK